MEGLSSRKIVENQEEIIELLRSTKRDGIEKLISYLKKEDYFSAPASTQYHLACVGGLAQHSLNVYYNMMELYYGKNWRQYPIKDSVPEYPQRDQEVDHENIIIVALLHDLCKVDFYSSYSRNVKENGTWHEVQAWKVDEKVPVCGHGSKSVIIAQQFIRLYLPEIQAISFHMGMQDEDKVYASTVSGVFKDVQLALYVHLADIKATFEEDVKVLKEDAMHNKSDEVADDDLPF